MTWNYRIIRKFHPIHAIFAIHEVYYDDDGKPYAVTGNPIFPQGETKEELLRDCEYYIAALDMPVLEFDSFEGQVRQGGTKTCK